MAIYREYENWLALGQQRPANALSPFYSRVYAGYSKEQLSCILENICDSRGELPIFDPMAGQAFALSTLTWFGHNVRINDINPAPLLLAWLRSGHVFQNFNHYTDSYKSWLKSVSSEVDGAFTQNKGKIEFITAWLSEPMRVQLKRYGELATECASGFSLESFSDIDPNVIFRLAIAVLAARRITCYMQSDNRTWLKPGGLSNKPLLTHALLEELNELSNCKLIQEFHYRVGLFGHCHGALEISNVSVTSSKLSTSKLEYIGITSPPYANRLDYSIMWAPELQVISAILDNVDEKSIQCNQIGTTRLREKSNFAGLDELPEQTKSELIQIRDAKAYASKSYYFPFFYQFAIDLKCGLENIAHSAPNAKKWVIFIRDTARKDVLFSAHSICENVLQNFNYERKPINDLQIIRSHIGLLRRSRSKSTIHGLAQREWWLVFEKKGTS